MKEKLELELNTISRIILLANSSLAVVKYLEYESADENPIIRYEKNFSYFFPFVSVNFYRITIIELCKLFNPRASASVPLVNASHVLKLKLCGHERDARASIRPAYASEKINF